MRRHKLTGLCGAFLLLFSTILPLSKMNGTNITILPLFNNFVINNVWEWINISAFAITYIISVVVCIWLIIEKKYVGIFISASAIAFVSLIIFMGILISKVNASPDALNNFSISWGWIIILLGILLVYFSGFRMLKQVRTNGQKKV
ncbi:hypothetical protein ABRY23_02890 [Melioribacteraceae bacterium 4301-Me]|uniref:hypothetical protein n=1 Tax=Pyranulibacter aquaticus TaxID=3163344 RepID=UPI0035997396